LNTPINKFFFPTANRKGEAEETMSTNKLLIACKVFYDELQSILPLKPELKIIWIEAALHANLNRLEGELKKALSEAATKVQKSSYS
jgi:hypothetical protein